MLLDTTDGMIIIDPCTAALNIKIGSLNKLKCISFAIIYTEMCGWWDVKGVCARIWRKLPHRWMLSSQQFVLAYWEFSHSKFFSWKICQKIYFSFSFSLHTINYFLPLICISMMEQSWCYMVEYLTFFVIYQTRVFYLKLIVLRIELIIVVDDVRAIVENCLKILNLQFSHSDSFYVEDQ